MKGSVNRAHVPVKDLKVGDIILLAHTDPWSLAQTPRLGECLAVHIDQIVHDQQHVVPRSQRRFGKSTTFTAPRVTFRPVQGFDGTNLILGEQERFTITTPGRYAWLAIELDAWRAWFGISTRSREMATV